MNSATVSENKLSPSDVADVKRSAKRNGKWKEEIHSFGRCMKCKANICAPAGSNFRMFTLIAVLAASTNFPEGYCNSYPNTSYRTFQDLINSSYIDRGTVEMSANVFTWYWSALLNVWFIGYLLGTLITPLLTDRLGRKLSLLLSNIAGLIGATFAFLAVSLKLPEMLFVSRIVASISSGVSFGALLLFIQEATPTEQRGLTSSISESTFIATTALGIGFGMDEIFGKNLPVLTGVSIIPAILSILVVLPLHETPKFCLINRGDRDSALRSLQYYRGNEGDNEEILNEMLLEEKEGSEKPKDGGGSFLMSALQVLSEGHLRVAFLCGCASLQLVVSIWPMIYLSTDLLRKNFSPLTSQLSSFSFILSDFAASLAGIYIIEKISRRQLLLSLGVLYTLCLFFYVLSDLLSPIWRAAKWGQVICLNLLGATYGVGLGPIAFFITSELVAQKQRSLVQSMVFAVNTIVNCLLSFATLPAYEWLGAAALLPLFVLPSIASLVLLFRYLPETGSREVHEIVEELQQKYSRSLSS